jgi:hypothetical protein
VFIFAPQGGISGPNVYNTEAALSTAMANAVSPTLVFYIPSGSYTFTTVGMLTLGKLTTWSLYPSQSITVTFSAGTTLSSPFAVNNGVNIIINQSASLYTVTGGTYMTSLYQGTTITINIGHFIDFTGVSTTQFALSLHDTSNITGESTNPLLVIANSGNTTVNVYGFNQSSIGAYIIALTVPTSSFQLAITDPGVMVDFEMYGYVNVGGFNGQGLYVDQNGNGPTHIPTNGAVGLMYSNQHIYTANGASWTLLI